MRRADGIQVALVTAPNLRVARSLARRFLEARAAACVNLLPRVESHYWWRGRIESGAEVLLIVKTTRARRELLERLVRHHHPYDTPEFIALRVAAGAPRYLAWVRASVLPVRAPARKPRRARGRAG